MALEIARITGSEYDSLCWGVDRKKREFQTLNVDRLMGEAFAWAELLKLAVEHREDIQRWWHRLADTLFGKPVPIAVTGIEAAGKTILVDTLVSDALRLGYRMPEASVVAERRARRAGRSTMQLIVIPGQKGRVRAMELRKAVGGIQPARGIVHVVCNGFVNVRGQILRRNLVRDGATTVSDLRKRMLREEIGDLKDLLKRMEIAAPRRRPRWMLIAVAKTDLFSKSPALDDAEEWYSEQGNSDFSAVLRQYKRDVDSDFEWSALPVAAMASDFLWNGGKVESQITDTQRVSLLVHFLHRLEQYCEL